jgi:hypothetical protein
VPPLGSSRSVITGWTNSEQPGAPPGNGCGGAAPRHIIARSGARPGARFADCSVLATGLLTKAIDAPEIANFREVHGRLRELASLMAVVVDRADRLRGH